MPFADDPDDEAGFVPPLPPEDRLWRHPSELGAKPSDGVVVAGPERVASVGVPRVWTVATASALLGIAITLAALSVTGTFDQTSSQTVVEQVEAPALPGATGDGAVAGRVDPALVRVDAVGPDGTTTTATGIVYRSDGHLLTTADAVDGATSVTVTTADGTVLAATVVGSDPATDIAVLDVDRDDMATVVIARVSEVEAGEAAMVVAREPDASGPAVVHGHVSALGLRVDLTDGTSLHDMIATALEAPTLAGGAVLCSNDGAVVGVLTARTPVDAAGLTQTSLISDTGTPTSTAPPSAAGATTGYATPIDYAVQVADEIVATGTVRHTWLGVFGDDVDLATAAQLGRSGVTLTRVMPDGPAARAELREGDIVLAVDGVQTTSMSALVVALRNHEPGDAVALTFVRDGDQRVTMATLTARS